MRYIILNILILSIKCRFILGNIEIIKESKDDNEQEIEMITDIIIRNIEDNGWKNIVLIGPLPSLLYKNLNYNKMHMTFSVADANKKNVNIKNNLPFYSNTIIINFVNVKQFETTMRMITSQSYWHPLANIILYYRGSYEKQVIAKIFFIIWYFRGINTIIIQSDISKKSLAISYYSPYISEHFKLQNLYGCWTTKKIGSPMKNYEKDFDCIENCNNVTVYSNLRAYNLGTCIGFNTYYVPYGDFMSLRQLVLFDDKAKNMHGFKLRGIAVELVPFLKVTQFPNGTFTLHMRDGLIWNMFAKYINFTIDLSSVQKMIKSSFNYEINVQQFFAFTQRKADLLMFPIYQFDVVVAEVDYTFPYTDSGVCFISPRAGFQMILFDAKLLQRNYKLIFEYVICFTSVWLVFFLYNAEWLNMLSWDQAGKDLMNTCKLVLSVSIDKEPKRKSFRIFLTFAIWSFFVINFSTQAAIISLFSVYKRGKNIDTFEDVYERLRDNRTTIEGIPSPDIVLPTSDERINKITSRLIPKQDMLECVKNMLNDSQRICLADCSVSRYLEGNFLNRKGEQYLHVARKDRVHSMYLNMLLNRHSPLTKHYNKYIMALFEAGIILKWMEYKYNDIKDEIPIKVLSMEDLAGIFQIYLLAIGVSVIIFILEVSIKLIPKIRANCILINHHKIVNVKIKNSLKVAFSKTIRLDTSTQTSIIE